MNCFALFSNVFALSQHKASDFMKYTNIYNQRLPNFCVNAVIEWKLALFALHIYIAISLYLFCLSFIEDQIIIKEKQMDEILILLQIKSTIIVATSLVGDIDGDVKHA